MVVRIGTGEPGDSGGALVRGGWVVSGESFLRASVLRRDLNED